MVDILNFYPKFLCALQNVIIKLEVISPSYKILAGKATNCNCSSCLNAFLIENSKACDIQRHVCMLKCVIKTCFLFKTNWIPIAAAQKLSLFSIKRNPEVGLQG